MRVRLLKRPAVILALLVCVGIGQAAAHDLPADVLVHVIVKPEGQKLHVLVRAPLRAMGDIDYPTRSPAGVLDLTQIDRPLRDALTLWIVPALRLYEDGVLLERVNLTAVRVSLPSDRSFDTYDNALTHIMGSAIPADTALEWNQGLLDAALDFEIRSDRSAFAIDLEMARLGVHVVTALRFLLPDGAVRAFELTGDPGLLPLDPSGVQAAWRFVRLGFVHIFGGADHLLFLVCLVIPVRRFHALVPVVTAFAVAHSITLIGAALNVASGGLWFGPLIETLIAASIVYMALENMLAVRFTHRWVVAFAFGLVHGFGFSFALRDSLQFAGAHLLASLVSFNIGVELGQLLVLLIVIPPLRLLVRHAASERVATTILSAVVAHTAWHWMVDRSVTLSQFTLRWPHADATFAAGLMGWLLLLVIAAGAFWGLAGLAARLRRREDEGGRTAEGRETLPRAPSRSAP